MKHLSVAALLLSIVLLGCRKSTPPTAAYTFRGDNPSQYKMGTYDTCTLFANDADAVSYVWHLGDGRIVSGKSVLLSFTQSGTYAVSLVVTDKDGQSNMTSKKVVVLDRVLKQIVVERVFWDTIPNSILNLNAVWPTSSKADVYVLLQDYKPGDSIVPRSGILPNSAIFYQSAIVPNISSRNHPPFTIPVTGRVVLDKMAITDRRKLAFSLMAKDANGLPYCLHSGMGSGTNMNVDENFDQNRFTVTYSLFSQVKLVCAFE